MAGRLWAWALALSTQSSELPLLNAKAVLGRQAKQVDVKGQGERYGSWAKSVPNLPSHHHDGAKYGGCFLPTLPVSIFCT